MTKPSDPPQPALANTVTLDPEVYSFKARIAQNRLPVLRANLDKLNRKAEKLGVAPFTVALGRRGEEFIENRSEGLSAHIQWIEVTLTGQSFALGDYRVRAMINHRDNMSSTVGNFRIPSQYLNCDPYCDHCKKVRARTRTWLLQDPEGNVSTVGSSCLEDFTGHAPEHALAATSIHTEFAEQCAALQGGYEDLVRGGKYEPATDSLPYLAIVHRLIRTGGWVSRETARSNREYGLEPNVSTSDMAIEVMKKHSPGGEIDDVRLGITPEDRARAAAALHHARAKYADLLDKPDVEGFECNMRSVTLADTFPTRYAPLAAYAMRMYLREVVEPALLIKPAEQSEHVGTQGKREVFTVTVQRLVPIESNYGTSMLHMLIDAAGNHLTWRNSGSRESDLQAGNTYTIKATVNRHDEYKGIKQTVLNRVAIEDPATPAAEAPPARRKKSAPAAQTEPDLSPSM